MKRIINALLVILLPSLAYPQSQHKGGSPINLTTENQLDLARRGSAPLPEKWSVLVRRDDSLQNGTSTDDRKSGFGFLIGYKFINIDDRTFQHNTHPDDSFLPRANQPGSAGTTVLNTSHWALFGAEYLRKISATSLTFDVGLLVGIAPAQRPGQSSSRKKNENDSRPDAQGAFIYSKPTYGLHGAVGFTYDLKKVSLGVEGQFSSVKIEDGWDRFGKDQKERSDTQSIPTIGPKIGLWLDSHARLEGTVQIGRSVHFGIALRYTF